jgi:hypothetical protein
MPLTPPMAPEANRAVLATAQQLLSLLDPGCWWGPIQEGLPPYLSCPHEAVCNAAAQVALAYSPTSQGRCPHCTDWLPTKPPAWRIFW